MDPYTFTLALGGAGLVAMAATGVGHSGPHTGAHTGPHGAPPGGPHAGGHGHHTAARHAASSTAGHHASGLKSGLLALASPRTLFSFLVGFGLTGVVVRPFLSGIMLLTGAVLGAIVFERALVEPLWRFLFRFASNPATTLDDSLMSEARAASGFDDKGQGLVAVEVDGQVVQCLGTLRADDLALGVRVRAGDVLRVEDVDAARSRCTVSFVGRARVS
jgi:hypothetical protein